MPSTLPALPYSVDHAGGATAHAKNPVGNQADLPSAADKESLISCCLLQAGPRHVCGPRAKILCLALSSSGICPNFGIGESKTLWEILNDFDRLLLMDALTLAFDQLMHVRIRSVKGTLRGCSSLTDDLLSSSAQNTIFCRLATSESGSWFIRFSDKAHQVLVIGQSTTGLYYMACSETMQLLPLFQGQ